MDVLGGKLTVLGNQIKSRSIWVGSVSLKSHNRELSRWSLASERPLVF